MSCLKHLGGIDLQRKPHSAKIVRLQHRCQLVRKYLYTKLTCSPTDAARMRVIEMVLDHIIEQYERRSGWKERRRYYQSTPHFNCAAKWDGHHNCHGFFLLPQRIKSPTNPISRTMKIRNKCSGVARLGKDQHLHKAQPLICPYIFFLQGEFGVAWSSEITNTGENWFKNCIIYRMGEQHQNVNIGDYNY